MKYEITYKDGETEIIRAGSFQDAIDQALLEEYIAKIEVL